MSGKKLRKLRDRLAREVIDGDITVAAALARLGRAAAVQKSAGASWSPAPVPVSVAPRYPGDESYVRSAFRPVPRPVVTAPPTAPRESPLQSLAILKSGALTVPGPVRPMRMATPVERTRLRAVEQITDPVTREKMRSGLMAQMEGVLT